MLKHRESPNSSLLSGASETTASSIGEFCEAGGYVKGKEIGEMKVWKYI